MKTNCKTYKLLEVIEMPENTNVHMINGEDYKINKNGELESKDGDTLPISKQNIDNCEFTIIEDKKNYNIRIYKNDYLIRSFNPSNIEPSRVQKLAKDLYDQYKDTDEEEYYSIHRLANEVPLFYMPRYRIEVKVEEIIESF